MAAVYVFICALILNFISLIGLFGENFYCFNSENVSSQNVNFPAVFIAASSPTTVCREANTITAAAAHLLFSTVLISSSCLHQLSSVLLWCRPPLSVPFRPRTRRSLLATLVALLLLCGDIQPNPGPPATTDYVTFGSLNIRSVATKAALVHDIIQDNNIQILALQETWLPLDTHPAIKQDAARSSGLCCASCSPTYRRWRSVSRWWSGCHLQ